MPHTIRILKFANGQWKSGFIHFSSDNILTPHVFVAKVFASKFWAEDYARARGWKSSMSEWENSPVCDEACIFVEFVEVND